MTKPTKKATKTTTKKSTAPTIASLIKTADDLAEPKAPVKDGPSLSMIQVRTSLALVETVRAASLLLRDEPKKVADLARVWADARTRLESKRITVFAAASRVATVLRSLA
jgi:hypothetical protein